MTTRLVERRYTSIDGLLVAPQMKLANWAT